MEVKNYYLDKKIKFLRLKDISVNKFYTAGDITETDITKEACIIKKNGIIIPLMVRKNIDNPKKYILVASPVTYFALHFLEVKKVPAIILSLTDAEAALFNLLSLNENNKVSFLNEAAFTDFIIKKGYFSKFELAERLILTESIIEERLSLLALKKDERLFIKNHGFSKNFAKTFLELTDNEKEKVKNKTVINKLDEKSAIDFINEMKNPKVKRVKTALFSDDTVILNSMERILDSLKGVGIEATFKKDITETEKNYTITVKNKPIQLRMKI